MGFDINQLMRVDAKMYRHFAVITLVVTLCVAFFADSENRQAIANDLDKRDQQAALRKAQEKKAAQQHVTFESRASAGPAMSDDLGGDYGSPMDDGAAKGSSTALPLPKANPWGLRQPCGRAAADRGALARMNEAQRAAYLAKLDEMDCSAGGGNQQEPPHQPTRSEINALAAASAARSGASAVD